jgi:hypothetical protein
MEIHNHVEVGMSDWMLQAAARAQGWDGGRLQDEDGFQTAEAIGIAAVGLLVLAGILGVLQVLGVDVINWIRDTFGIPGG